MRFLGVSKTGAADEEIPTIASYIPVTRPDQASGIRTQRFTLDVGLMYTLCKRANCHYHLRTQPFREQ